jgi:hypothetical protein
LESAVSAALTELIRIALIPIKDACDSLKVISPKTAIRDIPPPETTHLGPFMVSALFIVTFPKLISVQEIIKVSSGAAA